MSVEKTEIYREIGKNGNLHVAWKYDDEEAGPMVDIAMYIGPDSSGGFRRQVTSISHRLIQTLAASLDAPLEPVVEWESVSLDVVKKGDLVRKVHTGNGSVLRKFTVGSRRLMSEIRDESGVLWFNMYSYDSGYHLERKVRA